MHSLPSVVSASEPEPEPLACLLDANVVLDAVDDELSIKKDGIALLQHVK